MTNSVGWSSTFPLIVMGNVGASWAYTLVSASLESCNLEIAVSYSFDSPV